MTESIGPAERRYLQATGQWRTATALLDFDQYHLDEFAEVSD